jgi:hypothetical protein
MRASDAERERVADLLREACLEGRLDADELDERLAAAYRARTRGELAPLVADLPATATAAGLPAPGGARSAFPAPRRRAPVGAPTVAALAVLFAALAVALPGEAWLVLGVAAVALTALVMAMLAGVAPFLAAGGAAWWIVRRLMRDAQGPPRGAGGPESPRWADRDRP